jgi:protocatechuate 3,4-dioxygenase beta subunit
MKFRYSSLILMVLVYGMVVAQQGPKTPLIVDQIKFVSQPPSTGQAGIVYTYKAKAISSDSTAKIHYFPLPLTMNSIRPDTSVKVDSVSGVLTFIPPVKGWYTLGIVARSTKGGVATQMFYITVSGGNGIVQGKVTDTSGAGIKDVVLELYKTELTISTISMPGPNFQGEGGFLFMAVTDAAGNYRIADVDPGKYKLHALSPSRQYLSQWYDGQPTATLANVVIVNDTPAVTKVNFVLRSGVPIQQQVSVSGAVTDTLGVPIKKAQVFLVPSDFALNTNNTIDDFRNYFDMNAGKYDCRLDGRSPQVLNAKVDTNGKFNISVPPGSYIAFAEAQGYVTEYYKEQSNLLLATPIVVQQNVPVTKINFTLAPVPPVKLGSIAGNVLDSSKGVGVPARIIATRYQWVTTDRLNVGRCYVVDTDSLGDYSLGQLPPGTYFVFALPLGNYAPAYYSNDTANTRWKKATPITIDGNNVSGINIYVHRIPTSVSGYTGISGVVRTSGVNASAIAGAFVYATKNNQIAGYSITNNAGAYTIDGLAPGSYSVTVDNIGSTEPATSTVSVSYSGTGSPITATTNFSLSNATGVETSSAVLPEQFTLSQNFPNPFNPTTNINYTIQQPGVVTLKVYNLIGQEIQTLVNNYQTSGNYRVTFNAQNLSSGVYFYRLQSNNNALMRKMILLR